MLVLGTYETRRAVIHPWDPRVVEVAAALVVRIRSVVPDLAPEHVGSTSIPGMPGKGYVDVDLLTPAERVRDVAERLVADGWQRQTGEHAFPDTRPMLKALAISGDARMNVHLHVTPSAREVARDLAFRDALRRSPELVRRYEARKREVLAAGIDFGPDYARAKSDVILAILGELGIP